MRAAKKLPKIILLQSETEIIDKALVSLLWMSKGSSGRHLNHIYGIRRKLKGVISAPSFTNKQMENLLSAMCIAKLNDTPIFKKLFSFYGDHKAL
jgi:hypothetical protein